MGRATNTAIRTIGGLICTVALLTSGAPALAQNTDTSPDVTVWDVQTPDEGVRHSGRLRALVFDLQEHDGRMFVAGKFLEVVSPEGLVIDCLLYTSPSPRDLSTSRMPSSA